MSEELNNIEETVTDTVIEEPVVMEDPVILRTPQEKALLAFYAGENGIARKLFTPITRVGLDHKPLISAFKSFLRTFPENGGVEPTSFRLHDLISVREANRKKKIVFGHPGEMILCLSKMPSDPVLAKKIFSQSVTGFSELLDRTPGFKLNLDFLQDDDVLRLLSRRFVFVPVSRADKMITACQQKGVEVYRAGFVDLHPIIRIRRNGMTLVDLKREELLPPTDETFSVRCGREHSGYFASALMQMFAYKQLLISGQPAQLRLGLKSSLNSLLATLLAVYRGMNYLSLDGIRLITDPFTAGIEPETIAPSPVAGDYVHVLPSPRGEDGNINMMRINGINNYLDVVVSRGILRGLIPCRSTAEEALEEQIEDQLRFLRKDSVDPQEEQNSLLVISKEPLDGMRQIGTIGYQYED